MSTAPAKRLTYKAGSVIFEEGHRGDTAYVIVEGKVDIRIGTHGSQPRTLATCGKGEVIGELALFDDQPHIGTAVAAENTTLLSISWTEFDARVSAMDPVMRGIIRMMVKRLRQTVQELKPQANDVDWGHWQREKRE
ncbi:MAG: Crp/Fnr family transcriptional regulator [Rhodospirillales bacterium]|nr:Crp/Fnr family transcriptional regulator [Rhodospirillales bacterium]